MVLPADIPKTVEAIFREESRGILATLIRLLGGDFDLAEDALHDAFQAAIASVHAAAPSAAATDWSRVTALYDLLVHVSPSPVVELNRAVAMRDGPSAGVALIDDLFARGELDGYQPAHSARAELCRRLGKLEDARASYKQALALARQAPERRYLESRLRELG